MNDRDAQSVEKVLAKYRPAEAPTDLLHRVEQAALRRRQAWPKLFVGAISIAAEIVLGLVVRGLVTVTPLIVLLLVSMKGY